MATPKQFSAGDSTIWTVADAKARLSEVIEEEAGPGHPVLRRMRLRLPLGLRQNRRVPRLCLLAVGGIDRQAGIVAKFRAGRAMRLVFIDHHGPVARDIGSHYGGVGCGALGVTALGVTARGLKPLLAGALLLALAVPATAAARAKTRFDGIRDCERLAAVQFKRHNPQFRRFTIDRAAVEVDKFADKVGPTFVSTIYHGKATYDAAKGPRPTRFICLHGGVGNDAVFVYTLPE